VTALAVAAPQGYMKQMSTIFNPQDDYNWTSATGRKEVAKRGLGYLRDYNPFTGVGIANYGRAEGTLSAEAREREGVFRWTAAHNSYLQVLVETGPMGGVCFVAIIVTGLLTGRRVTRLMRRAPPDASHPRLMNAVTDYLPIAFLGFSITCFFLSFGYLDILYILAALAAGARGVARAAARQASLGSRPSLA
jgi:O-antigen ligase